MEERSGQKRASDYLYPAIEPFERRFIAVDNGHQLYVEQSGNPEGVPVVVFHGGPGGGSSPLMRRFFDPEFYRIVLFDQRGCGRSTPIASVAHNTTWDLVADAETICETLGIKRFISFGGSWGATLALIHAITHPERVLHLVLRGVFLMTKAELDWFYGGGAGAFFPDLWQRFIDPIPADEHGDLIAAYHRRLFSGSPEEELRFARAWMQWENALATIQSDGWLGQSPPDYARAFSRLENHYFSNHGFLPHDGWIEANRHRISDISVAIIQGRYDMVCPPAAAWRLAQGWPKARIDLIPMAGHALSEPGISAALVREMNMQRLRFRGLEGAP